MEMTRTETNRECRKYGGRMSTGQAYTLIMKRAFYPVTFLAVWDTLQMAVLEYEGIF
jgi:hypothetical protein